MGSATEALEPNVADAPTDDNGENDRPTSAKEKTENAPTETKTTDRLDAVIEVLGQSKRENVQLEVAPALKRRPKATCHATLPEEPPSFDIDAKHSRNLLFGSDVAVDLYAFLRTLEAERLNADGKELKLATPRPKFRSERTAMINFLFEHLTTFRTQSNTIHTAVYYVDRYVQKHKGPIKNIWAVMVSALHLASKYEDIYPVEIRQILSRVIPYRQTFKEKDVLALESDFLETLGDFMGLSTTAFAHRYLQAVGMEINPAAVCMARYLCAVAVSHYPFTGHPYSLLAAAAVFISYNKYSQSNASGKSVIEYPEAFEHHAGYTLDELAPIVKGLVELAEKLEKLDQVSNPARTVYPVAVYNYYNHKAGVTTAALPDFNAFFKKHTEPTKENAPPPSDA